MPPPGSSTARLVWLDFDACPTPAGRPFDAWFGKSGRIYVYLGVGGRRMRNAVDIARYQVSCSPTVRGHRTMDPVSGSWRRFRRCNSQQIGSSSLGGKRPDQVTNVRERVSETNRNSSEVSTLFHDPCSSVVGRAHYCTATDASSQAYLGRV
jgi:hypothetical protein